ncbi:hypothetical protein GJAV_G00116090 [Gymnothorax javanicus]|nr:hypothetical protein GJAV_G00116090 [Gymnothorax javanicus]
MAAAVSQFDEDWQDFNEFKPASAQQNRLVAGLLEDFNEFDNSSSGDIGRFKSMEDTVDDLEERLVLCFQNYGSQAENVVPVKPITEDDTLKNDEIWNSLTANFGSVMPVDWKTSHTRSLHLPSLNLVEKETLDNLSLDASDDEELREQLDMHSIIISCINEEPLFTAEQVIEEIEEMMQESPDSEEHEMPSQADLSLLTQDIQTFKSSSTKNGYEERIRRLCVAELTALLEEVETAIREYSEELIQQLAMRDELDFEKEVKNSFISVLIQVQNKQKEHRELLKRKRRLKSSGGAQQGRPERTHAPGTYLTTVIPYEKKAGPPSVEDLQILTKILHAMREDSDKVPSLLTDYILKVLCPT